MIELATVTEEIAGPAAAIWAVLTDFGHPERLAPTIDRATVTGDGVGAVRIVTSSRGLEIHEQLFECDSDAYRFRYAVLDSGDMRGAVVVQSQESVCDTAWLLQVALTCPRIVGVVGWADLRDHASIDALAGTVGLHGLRPMVQHRAADWYDDPALDDGLAVMAARGLALDALIRPHHLAALERLAARHPALRIVIDHAAKPSDPVAWRAAIAPLVQRPNVSVKLSGLWTEMSRDASGEVIATLLAQFGPERLLWGSDWPVVTPVGEYRDWLDFARDHIPERAHAAVFGGNAVSLYGLEEAVHA